MEQIIVIGIIVVIAAGVVVGVVVAPRLLKNRKFPRLGLPAPKLKTGPGNPSKMIEALKDLNERVTLLEEAYENLKQAPPQAPAVFVPREVSLGEALEQIVNSNGNGSGGRPDIIEPEAVEPQAEESKANPVRAQIIEVLRKESMKTGEIAKALNLPGAKVSKAVAKLAKEELVGKTSTDKWVLTIKAR